MQVTDSFDEIQRNQTHINTFIIHGGHVNAYKYAKERKCKWKKLPCNHEQVGIYAPPAWADEDGRLEAKCSKDKRCSLIKIEANSRYN